MTKVSDTEKLKFLNYNIFVPNDLRPILYRLLQVIAEQNFTKNDTNTSDYISRLIKVVQMVYHQEQNISTTTDHEGTFSGVAVMDTEDNYVSVVT